MRAQGPVHEGHLAEAVRRGVLSMDQMESVLAIARSELKASGANAPDLRWTTVVLGLAATVSVLVPGVALLSRVRRLSELTLIAACAVAVVSYGGVGRIVRERGWGRAPSSILTAGVAPYAGGFAMFAVDAMWHGLFGSYSYDSGLSGTPRDLVIAALFVVASAVTVAVGVALWRRWHLGPVWAVIGGCVSVVTVSAAAVVANSERSSDSLVFTALGGVVTAFFASARWWRPWLQRGGVDGAAWFELGLLAPGALIMAAELWRHSEHLLPSLAMASAVAAFGVWERRWTCQLVGALGLVWAAAVGLRHESMALRTGAFVAASVFIAAVAQWQRGREGAIAMREPPKEALSYWE